MDEEIWLVWRLPQWVRFCKLRASLKTTVRSSQFILDINQCQLFHWYTSDCAVCQPDSEAACPPWPTSSTLHRTCSPMYLSVAKWFTSSEKVLNLRLCLTNHLWVSPSHTWRRNFIHHNPLGCIRSFPWGGCEQEQEIHHQGKPSEGRRPFQSSLSCADQTGSNSSSWHFFFFPSESVRRAKLNKMYHFFTILELYVLFLSCRAGQAICDCFLTGKYIPYTPQIFSETHTYVFPSQKLICGHLSCSLHLK